MAEQEITLEARYTQLEDDRRPTTDTAELCSKMTIPYAFMEEDTTAQDALQRNYTQGFGAGLVNHLVGKLAGSILPASQPFYRLAATQEAMEAIAQGNEEAKFKIEQVLAEKENGILRYINNSNFRGSLYPALRLAVVTGNSLIEKLANDGKYRVINLRNYVVSRDYAGRVVELIIKEMLDRETLPEELQGLVDENKDKTEDIALYTGVKLIDGTYELTQELNGEKVGEESTIKELSDRFIDVRWNKIDGEDYGRGYVEESLGTFIALEKQMKVLNESAMVQSRTIFTVNPNGFTKYKDFVDATNGKVIIGQEADIGVVKVNKASDLQMTAQLVAEMKAELAEVFMKNNVRQSERTTAYEVQQKAQEIEASFGGVYTHIAHDIQMPLIREAMRHLKIDAKDDVDVIIMSGVQALGRSAELLKINQTMQELQMAGQLVGPEAIAGALNSQSLVTAIIANSGTANMNLIKSVTQQNEEIAASKQEQMAQQAVMSGTDAGVKQIVQGGQA